MAVDPEIVKMETACGTFTALSYGTSGPMVVCLHGFPDTARTFRHQITALCSAGYRVLVPTMRGYEKGSVQIEQNYYVHQLAEDILRWMDFVKAEQVHLIGHDWGSITAHGLAALAPDRIKGMTAIAVPHLRYFSRAMLRFPRQIKNSWYIQFFQIPHLAEWVVERKNWAFVDYLWRNWSPEWDIPEDVLPQIKFDFSQPGVKQATLSYYRCLLKIFSSEGLTSYRLLMAPISVPTLGITGVRDKCIDPAVFEFCMNPGAYRAAYQFERVDSAGHFAHLEQPNRVNRLILDWIRRCEGV